MAKAIFITATGTDVGKTYISALILKRMRELGLNCGYYKPAMSGIEKGKLSDVEYVFKISELKGNPMDFVSYPFTEALSPHLAAKRTGISINIDKIKTDFNKICKNCDYILVEGAGGITCPFNLDGQKLLLTDVIKALDLDILIIADAALGTINSTLLTVEYAKQKGINIQGIILNNYDEDDFMHVDNKEQIENLTGIKVISTVKKSEKNIKFRCHSEAKSYEILRYTQNDVIAEESHIITSIFKEIK